MKSVSVCLRRLRFLISRSLMRIYIPSHKMHISDLEVYFEKSVCNAKHIFIPAYIVISVIPS